jgi:prepilin-type N-terminal cleavage/methylation domain-containing protein
MRRLRAGFTLVELLVVMAIISVLASLLLPALASTKSKARATQCLNNLRQIGIASTLYASDNDDSLPRSEHQGQTWVASLRPYGGTTNIYRCPSDPNRKRLYSFAINDFLLPHADGHDFTRTTRIHSPAETLYLAECADAYEDSDHYHFHDPEDGGYSPAAFSAQVAVLRHQAAASYLFIDAHVERLTWKRTRPQLERVGSRLVNPSGHQAEP